jgi:hypothetical protein
MDTLKFLCDRLTVARGWTSSLLEDIDQSTWFNMPAPGINHVAWQVGHLAASQVSLIHVRCFAKDYDRCAPPGFREMFGKGSTPNANPGAYPPLADVRAAFDRIQAEALDLIASMSESDLNSPAGAEPHPLFSTKQGAIATTAMHETFHAGQIALLRRLAGKPPLR